MSRTPVTALLLLVPLASRAASAAGPYTVIDLGSLGRPGSQAHSINASAQIAGEATTTAGESHAFVYSAGIMRDLNINRSSSAARAINGSGQIAGYYYDRAYQAFLWTNGKTRDLGDLGGNYSAGYGLNASGHVCGSSFMKTGREHGFFWGGRRMTDVGTLGGDYSTARGINASDQVVGYAYLANGGFHAFLWSGGSMRDLGTLGGDYSAAYAINDAGQVVGQAYTPGNVASHATLWTGGTVRDLGDLGMHISQAFGIDSHGTRIVGNAVVPSNTGFTVYHAFVWEAGVMRDLNDLIPAGTGWTLQEADGINDNGEITGYGDRDGSVHAFLLEPAGLASAANGRGESIDATLEMRDASSSLASSRSTAAGLDLWHAGPNPAHARVEFAFALPRAGRVDVAVIDVAGRTVRCLEREDVAAGTHVRSWDLTDDSGRRVKPGAYYVRLGFGSEVRSLHTNVVSAPY